MVGVVTDLLKSGLDEGLKQLVRPVGLVPAALFVLLHALLTYPVLVAAHQPAATAISSLSELWQLVLLLVVILALGYLLQSASGWIGQLYTGDALPGSSWLTRWMQEGQRARLRRLSTRIDNLDPMSMEHKELALVRRRQFPWSVEGQLEGSLPNVMPTALGNAMLAPAWAVWNAYGIDPTATWAQLRAAAGADSLIVKAVDEEKTAIDTLLNTSAVLVAFAVTAPVLGLLISSFAFVPHGIVALLAAYGTYRVAIARSSAWADALRAAYDLHRTGLAKALGLAKDEVDVDRAVWEQASRDLTWDCGVGTPEATSAAAITALGANVSAVALPIAIRRQRVSGASAQLSVERRYGFVASAAGDAAAGTPVAFVRATDSACPARVAPSDIRLTTQGAATAVVVERGADGPGADDVIWRVSQLGPAASLLVEYTMLRTIAATMVPRAGMGTIQIGDPDDPDPSSLELTVHLPAPPAAGSEPLVVVYADDGQPSEAIAATWEDAGGEQAVTCDAVPGERAWALRVAAPGAGTGVLRITGA